MYSMAFRSVSTLDSFLLAGDGWNVLAQGGKTIADQFNPVSLPLVPSQNRSVLFFQALRRTAACTMPGCSRAGAGRAVVASRSC